MKVGRIFSYLDGETKQLGDVFQVACPFICLQPIQQADRPSTSTHKYNRASLLPSQPPLDLDKGQNLPIYSWMAPFYAISAGTSFTHSFITFCWAISRLIIDYMGMEGPTKELRVQEVKEDDDLAWDSPHSWLGSALPLRHLFLSGVQAIGCDIIMLILGR